MHRLKIEQAGQGPWSLMSKELELPTLNPGENSEVWFPHKLSLNFHGTTWLSCTITPKPDHEVWAYQTTEFPGPKPRHVNGWGNSVYVEERLALLQAQTNRLLLVLAVLTLVQGVWGLDNVWKGIWSSVADALVALAELLKPNSQ